MIRKANKEDIPKIEALISQNLDKLLPRSNEEISDLIDYFWVAEEEGEVIGCCCLEIYSKKIAEIRSVAVREDLRSHGIGADLVEEAVKEADSRGIAQIMVVTSTPEFFDRLNFKPCLNEKYALFWNGDK